MKYSIKFTAAELEMLNTALSSGALRFFEKSKGGGDDAKIYDNWNFETNALWLKVYAAQKIARAVEAEASARAA